MTVGVTPYERLQAWLDAAGFRRESALIEFALRVRTDVQREYLRSVYDSIETFGHILSRWQTAGTNCHGMADLAVAWTRYAPPTSGLGGIPARELARQPVDQSFNEARRDKVIDDRRDALYLLMQSMVPQGPDSEAHLTLKAWTFLHGLQLALHGQTTDENLSEACRVLRLAAYELPGGVWRRALEPFGQWTRTHGGLTEHIKGLRERGQLEKDRTARATARICRFAEGERRHFAEPDAYTTVPRPLEDIAPAPTPAERLEATSVELPPYLPLGNLAQSDDAEPDDLELSVVEVDPEASAEAQSLCARSARLQLGAAARLLAWDWPQVLPPERNALEQLVATALAEPVGHFVRLLASFTWFAMTAGLSLEEALQVPVMGSQPLSGDIDWLIDFARGHATRRPPRRADQRRPSAEQMDHLCPAAEALHVQLPDPVLAIWRSEASARSGLHRLGQLWNDSEVTASAAFRQWVGNNGATRRLQPSMLRHVLGQRAYEATGDHVLARLLPSTPDSALPAATVYAAFATCELGNVWPNLATTPPAPPIARLNAAGSLLDPSGDEQFADAFRKVRQAIETLREPERWIEFHNAVALYWDAALRAATGVRPVNDLWVSERDFDWDEGFVYVDDKASPVAASGRLIPLPAMLCGQLREQYLRLHLPWVLERLRQVGTPVPRTPFLFTVGRSGSNLRIEPIENSQRRSSQIGAPLPLNVFRHRLRTRLHRDQTVDKEIVDSLMGHGDGATLTHGDHSMRTWKTDAAVLRPALDRLYAQLSVVAPALMTDFEAEPCFRPIDSVTPLPSLRRRDRSPGGLKHLREAVRVIDRCLKGIEQHGAVQADAEATPQTLEIESHRALDPLLKRLAKLSSTQLDSLSIDLMKSSDTQIVDPTGVVRYQFLLRLAHEASSRFGIRFAIRKRYGIREIEDSPFRQEAAGALAALRRLRACLDTQFDGIRSASRLSLGLALLLLQIDLCAVSRIAHRPLFASLLEVPGRWRVVRLEGEFHLEWSPQANLRTDLDAACMRFQISARAAWLLTEIVAPRARRRAAWSEATPATSLLAAALDTAIDPVPVKPWTNAALLDRVVTLVDQANMIELPGSLAGYLGGRLMSASLAWGEWLQVRQGRWIDSTSITFPVDADLEDLAADNASPKCPRFARIDDEQDGDTIDPTPQTRIKRIDSMLIPPHDRARHARDIVQLVQRSIRELRETRGLTKRRQKRANSLARLIQDRSAGVSSTVRLLCSWAIDMLIRPGRSRKLATSSVERYFVALSPRFKTIGSDVEIDGMDDEQIEAFYRDILDLAPAKARSDVHAALRSFHAFAHRTAGLPAIDWSSVAVELDIALCAPGFVDESTYLRFVRHLGSWGSWPHALAWQLQCFAILCYRFGLRAGECAGLTRADLVWADDNVPHVLVRRNRLRALKTSGARRAVPLLFTLTEDEVTALRLLREARLPVFDRRDEELPLFALPERPEAPLDDLAVRRHLNMALQRFTGQAGTTLHDLRHSFATHVWAATQPSGWEVLDRAAPDQDVQRAKVLLLGVHAGAATRRAPWALARLMGHAHPRTAMQSYVHSISDVHRKLVDVSSVPCPELARVAVIRCINLDAATDFTARGVTELSRPEPDAATCLAALRHLAAGRTDAEVQDYTGLRLDVVQYLSAASVALAATMTASARGGMRKHLRADTASARLSPAGLTALVHAVAFPRMRDGLKKLCSDRAALPAEVASIEPEEWAAMVHDRREISLWARGHFELFSLVIRMLTPETRSVVLQVRKRKGPEDPDTAEVAELARATGWLPSPEGSTASRSPLCQSLTAVETGLPPVRRFRGSRHDRRAVLTFSTPPGGHVLDRIELIVCALCLCALARQQIDRWDTVRSMVA